MSKYWFYCFWSYNPKSPSFAESFTHCVFEGSFVELISSSLQNEEYYVNKTLIFCREISKEEYSQLKENL